MEKKITVSAIDIKRGIKRSSTFCPIARAAKRALKKRRGISVIPGLISVGNNRYYLPKKIAIFIHRFDTGESVKPFSFYLNIS